MGSKQTRSTLCVQCAAGWTDVQYSIVLLFRLQRISAEGFRLRTLKLANCKVQLFSFFSKCTELAILKLQGSASGVVGFLIQGAVKLALEMDAERWTITRQRRVDFQWRRNNAAFVPTARRTGLALALGKRWTWGTVTRRRFCLENPSSCVATPKRPDATPDPD